MFNNLSQLIRVGGIIAQIASFWNNFTTWVVQVDPLVKKIGKRWLFRSLNNLNNPKNGGGLFVFFIFIYVTLEKDLSSNAIFDYHPCT